MSLNCDSLPLDDDDLVFLDDAPRSIEVPSEVVVLIEEFKLAISKVDRLDVGRKLQRVLRSQKATELWDLLETGKILGQLDTVVHEIKVNNDNRIIQNIKGNEVNVAAATDGSTATVHRVSQQLTPGEFSGEALKAEIAELFALVADRIEALEEKDRPAAMEAITALKQVKFEGATSEEDARQMLEDLWTDKMMSRYSALGKILEAIKSVGPLVASLINSTS